MEISGNHNSFHLHVCYANELNYAETKWIRECFKFFINHCRMLPFNSRILYLSPYLSALSLSLTRPHSVMCCIVWKENMCSNFIQSNYLHVANKSIDLCSIETHTAYTAYARVCLSTCPSNLCITYSFTERVFIFDTLYIRTQSSIYPASPQFAVSTPKTWK